MFVGPSGRRGVTFQQWRLIFEIVGQEVGDKYRNEGFAFFNYVSFTPPIEPWKLTNISTEMKPLRLEIIVLGWFLFHERFCSDLGVSRPIEIGPGLLEHHGRKKN